MRRVGGGWGVGWGKWGFPNSCLLWKSVRDDPGYRLHRSNEDLFSFHVLLLTLEAFCETS